MADDIIPNSEDEVSGTPKPQKPKPSSVRMEKRKSIRGRFIAAKIKIVLPPKNEKDDNDKN